MQMFNSPIREEGSIQLPAFTDTRVMMLPVLLSDLDSLPDDLSHWREAYDALCKVAPCKTGVAYLTIDEKIVADGRTHRRAGLHVDGIGPKLSAGSWGGGGSWGGTTNPGSWGGGGGWGSVESGMISIASHVGCRAWNQDFVGFPGDEGDCEHLRPQLKEPIELKANVAYWMGGLCVHESIPQYKPVSRQFVRLSMPSTAPWFEGYTTNPKGILPTGPILPRRSFMDM